MSLTDYQDDIERKVNTLSKKTKVYSLVMFLVNVKVSEYNFNDFMRRSEEGVE